METPSPSPDQLQFLANLAAIPLQEAQRDALLLDMHGRISKIEAKVESLPDHETRIRVLERFRYAVPSISVISVVVAVVTAALTIH